MPPRARRYTYSERAGRYGLAGNAGRLVSRREIRASVDGALARGADAVGALTERLRRRELTLAEWQVAMVREIRAATLAAQAAAAGGFDRLSPADYGRAGAQLKAQYAYLRKWAAEIERTGHVDGRAIRRAGMYIESARAFHEREVGRDRERRGFDEVKSVRNARDSCTARGGTDGCIEQARKGWQRPGDYVYPGRRTCRSACRCFSLWRNSTTGEVAA